MAGKNDQAPWFNVSSPLDSVYPAVSAGGGGPFLSSRELGKVYHAPDGRRWQKVLYNTVLTAAAAVKTIVYWADISKCVVDTDLTDSQGGRNTVAGCIITGQSLPVASQYAWVLQEGTSITLAGIAVNFTAAGKITASSTQGKVTVTAQGTASVDEQIGTVHTAVDHSGDGGGDVVCDINIASRLY